MTWDAGKGGGVRRSGHSTVMADNDWLCLWHSRETPLETSLGNTTCRPNNQQLLLAHSSLPRTPQWPNTQLSKSRAGWSSELATDIHDTDTLVHNLHCTMPNHRAPLTELCVASRTIASLHFVWRNA